MLDVREDALLLDAVEVVVNPHSQGAASVTLMLLVGAMNPGPADQVAREMNTAIVPTSDT